MNNMEIKFRIWMPSHKRMVDNPYVQDINGNRDQINDFFNGKNNKFIWMQYTGLHDEHGKEIYVGDIVKFELHDTTEEPVIDIGQIVFHQETAGFVIYWDAAGMTNIDSEEFEIIGNIYQNPELLCI